MRQSYIRFSMLALVAVALTAGSCRKMLEVLPEDRLDQSMVYNSLADADAVVLGIYGQVAALGDRYILLNELRADLVDVTPNADPYLQQLSAHNVSADNPYADPAPFYKVIFNCNDALANFKIMADKGVLSQAEFAQRYSDIAVLRTWLYLQLGIHYGAVPYIKDAVTTVKDIPALNNAPKLPFDQLIDQLIADTKDLPYLEYLAYPAETSLVFTVDGSNTQKVFISKPHVLGELYLWKGDYYQAAYWYKKLLSGMDVGAPRIEYEVNENRISSFNFLVTFERSQDGSSLVNSLTDVGASWRSIFAIANTVREWSYEWNWSIPYSNSFAPGNPFVELMSKAGGYKIKPSQKVIDLWNAQTLTNGVPWDARGKMSYEIAPDGDPVITKLTDNATAPLSLLNKGGQWNIFRAAQAHLRFAEAANRDGQGRVAYALLNDGLINTFYYGAFSSGGTKIPGSFFELESEITHQGFGTGRVTYPVGSPYYFDARDNQSVARGVWYRNRGIRARAAMPNLALPGITYGPGTAGGYGSVMMGFDVDPVLLEDKIIEEDALELAFEGERWSDLTRIARRRNDPAFLADKIYEKLIKAGNPNAGAARAKLMDPKNWYLPFKL
ncbi:RagB/SusD family nutrient uptake outer membrane protein [Niabella aurantiaca]|uniref:RagB/SusD family nutrient uptake outer membrane protein n=1 Tax=Niabella aurantiaca TaxID=379900 RepID=UPI00035CDE0B|nr:RagB/SusD family nutrient uptake outer membrane protein [Niabella aurantiaca]